MHSHVHTLGHFTWSSALHGGHKVNIHTQCSRIAFNQTRWRGEISFSRKLAAAQLEDSMRSNGAIRAEFVPMQSETLGSSRKWESRLGDKLEKGSREESAALQEVKTPAQQKKFNCGHIQYAWSISLRCLSRCGSLGQLLIALVVRAAKSVSLGCNLKIGKVLLLLNGSDAYVNLKRCFIFCFCQICLVSWKIFSLLTFYIENSFTSAE